MVKTNPGASLIDLGDGVLCCEFHSKVNALGDDIMQMVRAGLAELETNFDAMVIGNQGENFSVGANLMMVLLAAQEGEWDELDAAVQRFQQMNMSLKYAREARGGRAVRHGAGRRLRSAAALRAAFRHRRRLYMGLVEVGVGADSRGRRLQGDADPSRRSEEGSSSRSVSRRSRRARWKRGNSVICAMATASR